MNCVTEMNQQSSLYGNTAGAFYHCGPALFVPSSETIMMKVQI